MGCPDEVPGPLPGVVVCHPHPLGGGNMNNNLVASVYLALIESGFVALRFNFRGVGNSEGSHAQGEKEPEDAEAALDLLKGRADVDADRLGMAGYSFGTGGNPGKPFEICGRQGLRPLLPARPLPGVPGR